MINYYWLPLNLRSLIDVFVLQLLIDAFRLQYAAVGITEEERQMRCEERLCTW